MQQMVTRCGPQWATVASGINKMVALSTTILARPKAPYYVVCRKHASRVKRIESPYVEYGAHIWNHFGLFTLVYSLLSHQASRGASSLYRGLGWQLGSLTFLWKDDKP